MDPPRPHPDWPLVVAYGLGVNSTAMLVEFARRGIKPDLILFADTGGEKPETYRYMPVIQAYLKEVKFPPVVTVRYEPKTAPYHTLEGQCLHTGTLPSLAYGGKTCSQKYKRGPQDKIILQHFPPAALQERGQRVVWAIGFDASETRRTYAGMVKAIGLDVGEEHRLTWSKPKPGDEDRKPSREAWLDANVFAYYYPLYDWGMDRAACERSTRITHAKTEDTFFLGTVLRVGKDRGAQPKVICKKTRRTRRFRQRLSYCSTTLKAPVGKLVAKLHTKGFCGKDGYPDSRRDWTPLDVDQIVRLYNSILRGLLNYYRFADNFARLGRIQYILRFSLAKTLAHKLRVPMTRVFREHGRNLLFRWELSGGRHREVSFAENTDWTVARRGFFRYPINIDLLTWHVGLRTKSKLGYPCLICGSQNGVQMHHVRHIRKMGGAKPQGFTAVMARLNRKQVPVCEDCHRKIHRGDFDGLSPKELAYGFAATPK